MLELTWLGQAGFLLKTTTSAVVIDPWFTDHELRLHPPPPLDALGDRLDWLLATHEHGDHLDLDLLATLSTRFRNLRIAVPSPLVESVERFFPSSSILGLQPGDHHDTGDFAIRAVTAHHAREMADGYSDGPRPGGRGVRWVGYVLEFPGHTIYHAGDTLVSERLLADLRGQRIDTAILPVNGRDAAREAQGIVGNLSPPEAVELALAVGASVLVPMHHDMVRGNTERAGSPSEWALEHSLPIHVLSLARFRPVALA